MHKSEVKDMILEYAAEATFIPTQDAYPGIAWTREIRRGARRYAIEYFERFGLLPRGKHRVRLWKKREDHWEVTYPSVFH